MCGFFWILYAQSGTVLATKVTFHLLPSQLQQLQHHNCFHISTFINRVTLTHSCNNTVSQAPHLPAGPIPWTQLPHPSNLYPCTANKQVCECFYVHVCVCVYACVCVCVCASKYACKFTHTCTHVVTCVALPCRSTPCCTRLHFGGVCGPFPAARSGSDWCVFASHILWPVWLQESRNRCVYFTCNSKTGKYN
jgi:hypothetical protein